jgi:hypothetical protein
MQGALPLRHRDPNSMALVECERYRCRMSARACVARQVAGIGGCGDCWDGAVRMADAGLWRWELCGCGGGCERCRGLGRVPIPQPIQRCETCRGSGRRATRSCPECGGSGLAMAKAS